MLSLPDVRLPTLAVFASAVKRAINAVCEAATSVQRRVAALFRGSLEISVINGAAPPSPARTRFCAPRAWLRARMRSRDFVFVALPARTASASASAMATTSTISSTTTTITWTTWTSSTVFTYNGVRASIDHRSTTRSAGMSCDAVSIAMSIASLIATSSSSGTAAVSLSPSTRAAIRSLLSRVGYEDATTISSGQAAVNDSPAMAPAITARSGGSRTDDLRSTNPAANGFQASPADHVISNAPSLPAVPLHIRVHRPRVDISMFLPTHGDAHDELVIFGPPRVFQGSGEHDLRLMVSNIAVPISHQRIADRAQTDSFLMRPNFVLRNTLASMSPNPLLAPQEAPVDPATQYCGCGTCPDGIAATEECRFLTIFRREQRFRRRATTSPAVGAINRRHTTCSTRPVFGRVRCYPVSR